MDPYHGLTDPDLDPDPAIFVNNLQDAKKIIFFFQVFCFLLVEGTFTSFSTDFCLMIEGSGSVPQTIGSGSGRSINIRWNPETLLTSKGINHRLFSLV